MGGNFSSKASDIATLIFFITMCRDIIPNAVRIFVSKQFDRLISYFYPNMDITFYEFSSKFKRSEAYTNIESYLASFSTDRVQRLTADVYKNSQTIYFSMDKHECVSDHFNGVTVKWFSSKTIPNKKTISFYPKDEERRFFLLNFDRKNRKMITGEYLTHVMQRGKQIAIRNRQRRLFTNNAGADDDLWSHVAFDHPSTFQTLAMEPTKKKEIMNDLIRFSESKEHYAKVGKAWKRGYLLYGPPGTGKSSMIAAMANLLNYDVYDLELTAVKENTQLKRLLIDTSSKSIIVIEDIDCSLDLTAKRNKVVHVPEDGQEKKKDEGSKVTLSGLLNFVDGLWSSSVGGERIFVFTTNHIEKLDPALIRRGRMDKHIEMGYCDFESFKILAKNYLDVESHHLFGKIEKLLGDVQIPPADIAENLTPKSPEQGVESCLESVIEALEKSNKTTRQSDKKNEEEEEEEEVKVRKGKLKLNLNQNRNRKL